MSTICSTLVYNIENNIGKSGSKTGKKGDTI